MNKVRCPTCGVYRDREGMRKQGLGFVCRDGCKPKSLTRIKAPKKAENKTPALNKSIVRQRDGECCRWCQRASTLEVHHIKYRSEGVDHSISNLLTLCQVHHMAVHSDKKRWKPILMETIRLTEAGTFLTVPEVEQKMRAAS